MIPQAFQDSLVRSPIYHQLNGQLRSELAGQYRRGDQFLTEREISQRYQVSRTTANKALASLVSEGLLEFRKGRGTFVMRDVIDYDLQTLVSFTDKARIAGKRPTTNVLLFQETTADRLEAAAREALGSEETEPIWEMKRLRRADGVPVILEHRYVRKAPCPKLSQSQLKGSLYRAWTEKHGLAIGGADDRIRAVALDGIEGKLLEVPARTPAFEVTSTGFLANGQPLWWEQTLYRGDSYEFHSRLGPLPAVTPARGVLRSKRPDSPEAAHKGSAAKSQR